LAVSAFGLVYALSRPGAAGCKAMVGLAAAPTLLAIAVILELAILPPNMWATRMIGTNSMVCLTYIPLIGIGPLGLFLIALRHGARSSSPAGSSTNRRRRVAAFK
jgi:hypothetical protein